MTVGAWGLERRTGSRPACLPRLLPVTSVSRPASLNLGLNRAGIPRKGSGEALSSWPLSAHLPSQIKQLSICLCCPTTTAWLSANPCPPDPREGPSCLHVLSPRQLTSCAHRCTSPWAHVVTDVHRHALSCPPIPRLTGAPCSGLRSTGSLCGQSKLKLSGPPRQSAFKIKGGRSSLVV